MLSLPSHLDVNVLPPTISSSLIALNDDPAVQAALRRSNEFQLNDSASYFFSSILRISSPSFLPTDQDILRSRVTTTGITETRFRINDLNYAIFDVGGQRSERKKWIHCFENVTALVFLVGLSEYDQVLIEDENVVSLLTNHHGSLLIDGVSQNRMQEALTLFESICNSRWFVKTSMVCYRRAPLSIDVLNPHDRFCS